jgi:hypothetical protein
MMRRITSSSFWNDPCMLENLAVFPTANANDLHLILVDSDNGSNTRWRDDDVILMD